MSLKDPKNRQLLDHFFIEHAPAIKKAVRSLKSAGKIPAHIEDDDLHEAGFHGLMEAVHRYDHDTAQRTAKEGSGNHFGKYADFKIKGHILDLADSHNPVDKGTRRRAKNLEALEAQQSSSAPSTKTETE